MPPPPNISEIEEPDLRPGHGAEDPAQASPHDPYAALRVPNYALFASGFLFSSTGLQMMSAALAWELYERTRDPLVLGLIGLARALPVVAMALPAGHIIDHFNRARVLFLTQSGFAVVAALLAWASWANAPVPVMLGLVVVAGLVRTFNGPVRSSLLPDLVAPEIFPNAVTWNSGVFQLSAVAGPLAQGAIIKYSGHAWPVYLITSVFCAVLAFSSLALKPKPSPRANGRPTLSGLTDGVRHLWNEKTILAALTLDLFAVLFGGATALLPIYAKDILSVGPVGYGWLRASPFIGAFVMAMWLAHRPLRRRAGVVLLWSVAGFGLCTIAFGVSRSFWISLAVLLVLGALDNVSVVVRHVLVQIRTPSALRGRVSAVNSVFIECSNELGAFESGGVAKLFAHLAATTVAAGAVFSVVSGGVGTILVVAAVAAAWPQLRKLGSLHEESRAAL